MSDVDTVQAQIQQALYLLEAELTSARSQRDGARNALSKVCPTPTREALLQALRESCQKAGLEQPTDLDEALQNDWKRKVGARTEVVERATALRVLAANIGGATQVPSNVRLGAWNSVVKQMPGADRSRMKLLGHAKEYLEKVQDVDRCPVCGQAVLQEALVAQLTTVLAEVSKWSGALHKASEGLRHHVDSLTAVVSGREALRTQAQRQGVSLPSLPPSPKSTLGQAREQCVEVDLEEAARYSKAVTTWDASAVSVIQSETPAVKPEDESLVRIIQLVELGKAWLAAESAIEAATRAVSSAQRLHAGFLVRQNKHFQEVMAQISSRVGRIYAFLHPGDNVTNAGLEFVGTKGVELGVDFHGQHQSPPHAVLSESHLNSLGIAVFLAMGITFNRVIGFVVLDDVVNSFDVSHRSRLAQLLATEVEEKQLIVLTHDVVFHQRLRRLAPSWGSMELTSWSYEKGPRTLAYQSTSLLERARRQLANDDARGAAGSARHALEDLLGEACEAMAAPLPFKRGADNERREPQELMNGVRRGIKDSHALGPPTKALLKLIEADLQSTLNVEVHAGEWWASPQEVADCLDRLGQLETSWTCTQCRTTVWAAGKPGACRCRCGSLVHP
jgi:hypothetical protein